MTPAKVHTPAKGTSAKLSIQKAPVDGIQEYGSSDHLQESAEPFFSLNPKEPFFQKPSKAAHASIQTKPEVDDSSQQAPLEAKEPLHTYSTDYGEFRTTKLESLSRKKMEINLLFHPNPEVVDATKIGFSQSVKSTDTVGKPILNNKSQGENLTEEARTVGADKPGAGYAIDQLGYINNPIYSQKAFLGKGEGLGDTPVCPGGYPCPDLTSSNYRLGKCAKPYAASRSDALFSDKPGDGDIGIGYSTMFETAALAIEGVDKGKYYGSVVWGYTFIEGPDGRPTIKPIDIAPGSKGVPTENFIEAAKVWNEGKTNGTLIVAVDSAKVQDMKTSAYIQLPKNTKLREIELLMVGKADSTDVEQEVKVEVLTDKGKGTGQVVYIKPTDVADSGDGAANVPLPIPDTSKK